MRARTFALIVSLGIASLGVEPAGAQSAVAAAGVVESTTGGFRFPDGTLQLSAASSMPLENVIRVSALGGDYTNLEDALDSIVGPSASNRFLVDVGPGLYPVTGDAVVSEYVHLRGAGPNVTRITSSRTGSTPSEAATLRLSDLGRISNLAIGNDGAASTYAIGLYLAGASRDTAIDNVVAEADGSGGLGHYAVFLDDAEPTIERSVLRASGGQFLSAALGVRNQEGALPQPLVRSSILNGGNGSDLDCDGSSGTGMGVQGSNAAPVITNSRICADLRGLVANASGIMRVQGSVIQVSEDGIPFEQTATGGFRVATSGVFYSGLVMIGANTSITCTQSYTASFSDANADCG